MAESQKNQARGQSPTLADQIASQLQDTKHPTWHMGSKPTGSVSTHQKRINQQHNTQAPPHHKPCKPKLHLIASQQPATDN
jgi:hypothetical protein